jgi:hypothetical protein
MKKILGAALVVSSMLLGCSSMVNPIEIEQPGYEMSPIQLQPGFERCSTIEPSEATKAQIDLEIAPALAALSGNKSGVSRQGVTGGTSSTTARASRRATSATRRLRSRSAC